MKRKIAAILAADVAEYSRLVAEDEEDALARLMTAQAVFQESTAKHRGRIFNTAGDAILAEFASAVDAARAAIDIQQQMGIRNQAHFPGRQLHFRIGLSIGDVVEHGTDLLGDGVNIASRLQALAPLGGLAVSHWVQEQTVGKVGTTFRDIGRQSLRNIPAPVHVFVADLAPSTVAAVEPGPEEVAPTNNGSRAMISVATAVIILLAGIAYKLNYPASSDRAPQNTTVAVPPIAVPAPSPQVARPPETNTTPTITPTPSPAVLTPAPPAVQLPPQKLDVPAVPQALPRPAVTQAPAQPAPKEPATDRKRVARSCAEVLERAQLGDTTPEDQAFLRNQCR